MIYLICTSARFNVKEEVYLQQPSIKSNPIKVWFIRMHYFIPKLSKKCININILTWRSFATTSSRDVVCVILNDVRHYLMLVNLHGCRPVFHALLCKRAQKNVSRQLDYKLVHQIRISLITSVQYHISRDPLMKTRESFCTFFK